jgi:hypothetical protein
VVHTPYCCALNWRGASRTDACDGALRSICHRGSACRCPIHGDLQALTLGTFFKCHRCRCLIRTELECSGFDFDVRACTECFACWRVTFLASPRKVTKRRRPRRSRSRFARLPCDARRNGPPRNSLSRPGGRLHSDIRDGQLPSRLRFSAGPTGLHPWRQVVCLSFWLIQAPTCGLMSFSGSPWARREAQDTEGMSPSTV